MIDPMPHSRRSWIRLPLMLALLLLLPGAGDGLARDNLLTLGVLAFRPLAQTAARWQPLADYLSAMVPGYRIRLRAMNFVELDQALARRQVDLLLTSPGHYAAIRHSDAMSGAIATLIEERDGEPVRAVAGAIIARADRPGLNRLSDLRGRVIAVGDNRSLGGYQAQAWEMRQEAGLDVVTQCRLRLLAAPQDEVVRAVLADRVDAGFVRAGLLEDMEREGILPEAPKIKLLHRLDTPGFAALVSTKLYPGRPFVALAQVPEDVTRRLAAALLGLEHDGILAHRLDIHGFTIPANYAANEDLLRELRLPPFDRTPAFTLTDIWARYRWFIVGLLIATLVSAVLFFRLQVANHRLRRVYLLANEERERLRILGDNLPESAVYQYTQGRDGRPRFLYISDGIERITGIPAARIMREAQALLGMVAPGMIPYLRKAERVSLRTMAPINLDLALQVGERARWVHLCASPRRLPRGQVLWDGVLTDITERKRMEEALTDSESRLTKAQALAHIGNWEWDLATGLFTVSDETFRIYGFQPHSLVPNAELFFSTLHPDSRETVQQSIDQLLAGEKPVGIDFAFHRQDGTLAQAHAIGELIRDAEGRPARLAGTVQDITAQKQAQTVIQTALAEKDILLKEVHHRVKNNLQVITSMLNLQSRRQDDPGLAAALAELRNRVLSMSLIHEKLYRSSNLAQVEFCSYMRELAARVIASATLEGGPQARLSASQEPVWLGLDAAIPCGLIVNELVTNSVKHAFAGRENGSILLAVSAGQTGEVELSVADDGVGLPEDIDPERAGTLGLKLVSMLVGQLGGRLAISRDQGTRISVCFSPKGRGRQP